MSTIREVAALAKVSPATVSRVINCDPTYKITNETKERVWQAVAKLNYRASVKKRTLQENETDNMNKAKIGCILNTTDTQMIDPYFMVILSDFEARMMEKGYNITMISTGNELKNRNWLTQTFGKSYDGLLLMESLDDQNYQLIRKSVKNLVGIDTAHRDIDNVGYDHHKAADIAVNYLYEKGYREIGFIGGSNIYATTLDRSARFKGYYSAMHYLGLEVRDKWLIDCKWNDELCVKAVSRLCDEKDLPEAFFIGSDLMAVAAISALREKGIRIPEDIGIVGVSDISIAKYSNPPLTTIEVSMNEMGKVAADVMIERLNGNRGKPMRYILPCNIIERQTTICKS